MSTGDVLVGVLALFPPVPSGTAIAIVGNRVAVMMPNETYIINLKFLFLRHRFIDRFYHTHANFQMWYYLIVKKLVKAKTNIIAATVLAIGVASLFYGHAVLAESTCGDTKTFFNWNCSDGTNPILGMLSTILGWAAAAVIPVCTIGIVVGAIMYASSGDNQANAKKGLDVIRNAIFALVIWAAARGILLFVIPS